MMNMCLGVDKLASSSSSSSRARRLERQSSIENEPLTLDVQQIAFAREAALYVVNTTTSIDEALRIFTEGLHLQSAVRYNTEAAAATLLNSSSTSDDSEEEEEEESQLGCESCLRTQRRPRDIVSAPF